MVKEIETEVYIENVIGLGPGIEVPQEVIQWTGIELTKVGVGIEDKDPGLHLEKERTHQGLGPVPMLVQTGTAQGAIDAMKMTTSLENALMLCRMKNTKQFYNC